MTNITEWDLFIPYINAYWLSIIQKKIWMSSPSMRGINIRRVKLYSNWSLNAMVIKSSVQPNRHLFNQGNFDKLPFHSVGHTALVLFVNWKRSVRTKGNIHIYIHICVFTETICTASTTASLFFVLYSLFYFSDHWQMLSFSNFTHFLNALESKSIREVFCLFCLFLQ